MTALPARAGQSRALRTAPVLLTLCSALLYAAAFPPLGLYPLAWVALVPFFVALTKVGPLAAAGLGLLWSLGLGLGTASALPHMIGSFFGAGPLLGWSGLAVASLALSGTYLAPIAAWIAWRSRRAPLGPVALACAWGVYEYARASLLIPNPWALVAYSQAPFESFVQLADVVGPFGLGMLIAAVNACGASLFASGLRTRRPLVGGGAVACAIALAVAYGSLRLAESAERGEPLDVALVQSAAHPSWRARHSAAVHRGENLDRHLELTASALDREPDLVLWPEFAVDFYLRDRGPHRERLLATLREHAGEVLIGAPDYTYASSGPALYNAAFLLRAGHVVARHRKVHLMPFSEENPLRAVARIGRDRYTRGSHAEPLPSRHAAIGVLLCSEVIHPAHVRELAAAGAELLANPSNDDWLVGAGAADQLMQAVALRAIENRRWIVRPSVNGYTAVVDPHGRVRQAAPTEQPSVLVAGVYASGVTTPYQRFGDVAPWLAIGVLFLLTLPLTLTAALRRRNDRRPS